MTIAGRSFATWRGAAPYRICMNDKWSYRVNGRGMSSTVGIFPEYFSWGWQRPYAGGYEAAVTYDGNGWACAANTWRVTNPEPGGTYRILLKPCSAYCRIVYVVHEQWVEIYPTRTSWDRAKPAKVRRYLDRTFYWPG